MPAQSNWNVPWDVFEQQISGMFRGRPYQTHYERMGTEDDPFLRYSIRPQGTKMSPLTLDISPGPQTGAFGASYHIRSTQSDWHATMGAEAWLPEEGKPVLRDPAENLRQYIEASIGTAQQSGPYGETAREAFTRLTSLGDPQWQLAGSLVRAGGPETESTRRDIASWVSVGIDPGIRDTGQALQNLYGYMQQPTSQATRWQRLRGHVPFSETTSRGGTSIIRMKPGGRLISEQGDVLGIGTSAEDIIKRRSLAYGLTGTREAVDLYAPSPRDPYSLQKQEPGLISSMQSRTGYKYANMLFPGETQRRAGVVRPGTEVRGGSLYPGGQLSYSNVLEGTFMGGYPSRSQVGERLPQERIDLVSKGQYEFGVFEGGERQRDLEGFFLPAGETATIGRYTLPSPKPGEEPVTRDITYTAQGRGIAFTGPPTVHLPPAMYVGGTKQGLGHAGIDPSGRLPKGVSPLSPAMREQIRERTGVPTKFSTRGEAFISFPTALQTGISGKGFGWKFGDIPVAGSEQIPQEMLQRIVGGKTLQTRHVTAEMKSPLPAFMGMFGTLPTQKQRQMVEQTFPGGIGRQMSAYIQEEFERTQRMDIERASQGGTPMRGAFSAEGLAEVWYRGQGGEGEVGPETAYNMFESMRQRFRKLPAETQAEFGEAQLGDVWGAPVVTTSEQRRMWRREALSTFLGQGMGAQEARQTVRQRMRFTPVDGDRYVMETRSPTYMTTSFTQPTPEFMAGQGRFGLAERATVTSQYGDIARFLGIHTAQDPYASGHRPPHVQAWDVISDVYRYNKQGRQFRSRTGEDQGSPPLMEPAVELTPERQLALQEAIAGGADLEKLAEVTQGWGQGPLYRSDMPHGRQYLEQPQSLLDVTEFEFGERGGQAINRITRRYQQALKSFAMGGTEGLGGLQQARRFALETRAGTAVKNYVSSYLAQSTGGRYTGLTGTDPGVGIISEERLQTVFKQLAQSQNIPLTEQRQAEWMGQVEERMRAGEFAGVGIRYPVLGETTGSTVMSMMTPKIAEEVYGISQAKASRMGRGGELLPGDPSQFMAFRAGEGFYKPLGGDIDIDPALLGLSMQVNRASGKLRFTGEKELQALLGGGARGVQRQSDEMLRTMMGQEGGIAGGRFNEVAQAIMSLGESRGGGPGLTTTSQGALWGEAVGAMTAGHGMGLAYNQRRLFRAAAGAAGFTPEEVGRGVSGGALGYQRYLDKLLGEKGQFKNVESMMQSMFFAERKQQPYLGSRFGEGGKWVPLAEHAENPQVQARSINQLLGSTARTAVSRDVAAGHMTPTYAGMLLAQKGVAEPSEVESIIESAMGGGYKDISRRLMEVQSREGYDITKTPIGISAVSQAVARLPGRTAKRPSGEEYNVLEAIGDYGFTFQGSQYKIRDLYRAGAIGQTLPQAKQAIAKEGPLLPSEVARIGGISGDMPYAAQAIMSAYGQRDVAAIQQAQEQSGQWYTPEELQIPETGTATQVRRYDRKSASVTTPGGGTQPADIDPDGNVTVPAGGGGGAVGSGGGSSVGGRSYRRRGGGGGGGGGGDGDGIKVGVYHEFMGQSRLRAESEQIYARGVQAYEQLLSQRQGGRGVGETFYGRIQQLFEEQYGISAEAFQRRFESDVGSKRGAQIERTDFQRLLTGLQQKAPEQFRRLYADFGQDIRGISRLRKQISQAAQEGKKAEIESFKEDIFTATDIGELNLTGAVEGSGYVGMKGLAAQRLQEIGREQGLFKRGAEIVPTEEEEKRITGTTKELNQALGDFTEQLEKSRDVAKEERVTRKEAIELEQRQQQLRLKDIQAQRAQMAPAMRTVRERLAAARDEGRPTAELEEQLAGLQAKQGRLAQQEMGIYQQMQGRGWQTALKRLTGGWNLMYMGRMLTLGAGQFQQGYGETQQYMTQMGAAATGLYGAQATPFASPEMRYQRALLRSGGGVMGGLRGLQAGVAGTPFSDVAGAGLTGLGVTSVAGFAGNILAGMGGGLGTLGAGLSAAALPLGIGAAALGLGGAQYQYWRGSDEEALRLAASGLGREGGPGTRGARFGTWWKLGLKTTWQTTRRAWQETMAGRGNEPAEMVGPINRKREYETLARQVLRGGRQDLTTEEIQNLGTVMGQAPGIAEVLSPEVAGPLFMQGLQAGIRGPRLENMVRQIGMAQQAGMPIGKIAQAEMGILGQGLRTPAETFELRGRLSAMTQAQQTQYQRTLELAGQTPGITGIIQERARGRFVGEYETRRPMTPEDVLRGEFGEQLAGIQGGRWESQFLERAQLRSQMRGLGMEGPTLDYDMYQRDQEWSMQQRAQQYAQNQLLQRQAGAQGQLLGLGIQGYGGMIEGMNIRQMSMLQNAMSFKPNTLTMLARQGGLPDIFATRDIGLGGQMTGLPWGTTGLQAGGTSAQQMAARIFGQGWQDSGAARVATEGIEDPSGQMVGGERGLRWAMTYAQRGMQEDQMGLQRERLGLQAWYMRNQWDIQDRQRALQHRQRLWGFEMEERRFDMQGDQFFERRGLQRRQQLSRRQWQRQDWAFADQQRALQWQWQQEDFAENIRFMSGRQRKLAERQMERRTIMHGLEGTQIERRRERQQETWQMADEQFEMQKEHFEERRELIEENMEKQREFYEEGRQLQEEMIDLQREYWERQHALALRQLELQEEHKTTVEELQDAQRLLNEKQQDRIAALEKERELDPAGTIEDIVEAFKNLQDAGMVFADNVGRFLPYDHPLTGPYDTAPVGERQTGGDLTAGGSYITGEREPEIVRPGRIGSVVTMGDIREAKRLYRDRWGDSTSFFNDAESGGGAGGQTINVYIGNKRIKSFIVDSVSEELQ